jgi:rubrerythrin
MGSIKITHGKWVSNGIPESILSACSVCGFPCGALTFNYCPQCGAMMDK